MAIYELEERVFFDGALPVDMAEADDMSNQEPVESEQYPADSSNGEQFSIENVSIAGGKYSAESEQAVDIEADHAPGLTGDYPSIDSGSPSANSSYALDAIFDSLYSVELSDISDIGNLNSEVNNVLLISTENEIVCNISSLINDNTVLVEYSPDDSVETILENIKSELGGNNLVNIGIVTGNQSAETCGNTSFSAAELTDALTEIKTVNGEINFMNFELGGESVNSSFTLTTYFNTESSQFDSFFGDVFPHASTNTSTLQPINLSTDIYFIDSAVEDADVLIGEISSENPDAVIIELAEGEGIDAMTDIVEEYSDIDSVHILSQGNYAQILLGDDVITSDNISEYKDAFSSWNDNLTQDADILFYGCEIAKEAAGKEVLNQIADWTGADIAASTDITGGFSTAESAEGIFISLESNIQHPTSNIIPNWDLEYTIGSIEASAIAAVEYNPHLETYTVTEATDDGSGTVEGTLSWSVEQANATTTVDDIIKIQDELDTITINSELKITDTVIIDGGDGVDIQVVDPGTSNYRVFTIDTSNETVEISNINIAGGDISQNNGSDAYGGALYIIEGTAVLNNVSISDSVAYAGGAVYNSGTLAFNGNNTFSNNISNTGDSIFNNGTIKLNNSTLNFADENALAFSDDAVFNTGSSTIIYSSDSEQVISDIEYNNLVLENGSKIIEDGNISANSDITIDCNIETSTNRLLVTSENTTITENGNISANGGTVRMESSDTILTYGNIDVSNEAGVGGEVYLLADHVGLFDNATINADGATGGGKVRVGGGWQGGEDLQEASAVYMGSNAIITADAINSGNAGTVVLWSNGITKFYGTIRAEALGLYGNGGQVEVSGKESLGYYGIVNVDSNNGEAGNILLDPKSITIVVGTTGSGSADAELPFVDYAFQASSDETISTGALEAITSGTITLQVDYNAHSYPNGPYIEISDLSANGGDGTLTLQSDVSLALFIGGGSYSGEGPIIIDNCENTIILQGSGSLYIDNDVSNTLPTYAKIENLCNIQTETGDIFLYSGDGVNINGNLTTQGGDIYIDADADDAKVGTLTLSADYSITTNGGNLTLKTGLGGTYLYSPVSLDTGTITFTKTAETDPTYYMGGEISASGNIEISQDVTMLEGAAITTTGDVSFGNSVTMTSSSTLTLTGTGFSFSENIAGNNGQITFRPPTASSDLAITSLSTVFSKLSGFSQITCGRDDGTGTLTFGADTIVSQPSKFIMGGSGGIVTVDGNVEATGTAGIMLEAGGTLNINNNIQTDEGNISAIGETLNLASGKSLTSTNGGDITILANDWNFNGTASSTGMLTLRAYNNTSITIDPTTIHEPGSLLITPEMLTEAGGIFSNFTSLILGDTTHTTAVYIDEAFVLDFADNGLGIAAGSGGIIEDSNVVLSLTPDLTLNTTGDIDMGTENLFSGTVSFQAGNDVTIRDSDTLAVGASTVNGNLILVSPDDITLAGELVVDGSFTKDGVGNFITGGNTLTLGSLILSAGTFNLANSGGTWTVNGDVSVAEDAVLNATSGTMNIGGNFTNSGTFNNNSGTVNYNGAAQNIASGNYYNLILAGTDSKILANGNIVLANNLITSQTLTVSNGSLSVSGTSEIGGDITTSGAQTYTGAVTLATSDILLSATTATFISTVNNATILYYNFEDSSEVDDFTMSGDAPWYISTTSGTYALQAGSITHDESSSASIDITVEGDESVDMTFELKTSTESVYDYFLLYVDGTQIMRQAGIHDYTEISTQLSTGSHTITFTYDKDYMGSEGDDTVWVTDITIPGAGSASPNLTIDGNAVFENTVGGISELTSLSVTGTSSIRANITTTGTQNYTGLVTLTNNGGTTELSSTNSNITFAGGITDDSLIVNLSVNSGRADTEISSSIDIGGILTKEGTGNFITNGNTITSGGLVINGGTFNSDSASGDWDINGNVTIGTSGTLNATTGNFNISGNWSNAGTFNANNGEVVFDGTGDSEITGSTTFYNFTCTTAGKILKFDSTDTALQTISNLFTLTGEAGNLITVSTTIASDQAHIDVNNSDASYVDVQDSYNEGNDIYAPNSSDGDNNVGWIFGEMHYEFSEIVLSPIAGIGFSITVSAKDESGNIINTYDSSATISDTSGTISPATGSFVNGVLNLTVTVTAAGSDTITVSNANSSVIAESNEFTVLASTFSQFGFVSSTSTVTAGENFNVTVTAQDQYGNTVTDYNGTVSLASEGVEQEYTFDSTDSGEHTFEYTLTTAGEQTITVSDGTIIEANVTVDVTAAAINEFVFDEISTEKAGTGFNITVSAFDQFGNLTSYAGNATLTDALGGMNPTLLQFTDGTCTYAAILNANGNDRLIINIDDITSYSNWFTVNASVDPNKPSVNNGMMINDGTSFQTQTSWRNSVDNGPQNDIDSNEGFEPNEVEGIGLMMGSLITFDLSVGGVGDGEYSVGTGTASAFMFDGEYGINRSDSGSIPDGEYGINNAEEGGDEYGAVDLTFNFDGSDDCVNFEGMAVLAQKHPTFKTELDLLLEKI